MSVINTGVLLTKRGFLVNAILFFVFFTLYFVFSFHVIRNGISSASDRPWVQASFNFVLAITLLLTSFFIQKTNKLHVIYVSSTLASIIMVFLFIVSNDIFRLLSIFMVGILLGVGQLAFLTYFWNLTVPEERGRVGGLIGFVTLPFYFIIIVLAETSDFLGTVMLSIVLGLGTLSVKLLKPQQASLAKKNDKRGNYFEKKTVILYSIPWIMFSLINVTLAKNASLSISQQVPSSFYLFLTFLQIVATFLGTLGGGIIADIFGRRLSLALAVTSYGISSALAGLVQNDAIFYFVYFANGLSWGILLAMYSFVVWGDLANQENCAKMYSIGLIILYLTTGIGFLIPVSNIPLVVGALVSCLLIFFSNVPLALAPELLSSDFRERIKLKLHMNAVKKIKQPKNQG